MSKRVAIVGGGVTGLAAAYELERTTDVEIDLYEASDRLGGKIKTERVDGFLVEHGPDCYFTHKPGVVELVCELGLDDEVVDPLRNEFSILIAGKIERIPAGLVSLTYPNVEAIDQATFLSEESRLEVRAEIQQPKGTGEDESLRSFFERRFGKEFTRNVVEPLLAGTHGGCAQSLSVKALFPGYVKLEQTYGSLAGSGVALPSGKPTFLSFRNGMQTLVDALVSRLERTKVHLKSSPAVNEIKADQTLLAIPSNAAANLLPSIAEPLLAIRHHSSAIHTFAFDADQVGHELNGTGFLVPPDEARLVTGSTWSSQKWPGRAPEGKVLLRVFSRVDASPAAALDEVRPLLQISGKPSLSLTSKWIEAMPQYEVGHAERLEKIYQAMAEFPNIVLAGTSYKGIGIPDSIQQGRHAAIQIAEKL